MNNKQTAESRIIFSLLIVISALICAAIIIVLLKPYVAFDVSGAGGNRIVGIGETTVPLSSGSDGSESFEYPFSFIPENYSDPPWEATFPLLEEQYAAAAAMGYEFYDENDCRIIFDGINDRRAQEGLERIELVTSGNLYKYTYVRASEIMEKYSHERPDGKHSMLAMPGEYLQGEILNGKTTPLRALQSWLDSPVHLEIILIPDITEMAVAGIYGSGNEPYDKQVVLFGNRGRE